MRHAGAAALDRLEPFLVELRLIPGLVEKKRGAFYRKSAAFLHFHEDPSGLYADVRLSEDFDRFCVESEDDRTELLARIRSL